MKIALVTFSPAGGTLKCASALAETMGTVVRRIDLTLPGTADEALVEGVDVAVIAVPAYGGRVPALAAGRLAEVRAAGTPAVLMAVYGNRAFDDTLVELADTARRQGFAAVAAIGAVAQHCMDPKTATGRPDASDLERLRAFGAAVAAKIEAGDGGEPLIPGNRPYKKAGAGMAPVTGPACTACGVCASLCPAGAIPDDRPQLVDAAKCIGCMRCVTVCPAKARQLPAAKRLMVHTFLAATAGRRKEPQLYI